MITQTIDSYFSISLDHEHDPICGFFLPDERNSQKEDNVSAAKPN